MSETEKNIELNRKTSDLIAGILCSGFSIVGIIIMDKSELISWVTIVFFGIGAILLLLRYFNPNSKLFPKQKDYNKKLSEEEFMELYDSNGIFTYEKNGFELKIEEKLTKVEWNEIKKLTAYKVDLFATDEIRLFLEAENGKQFEISESTEGWFQFNEKIKGQFPEINKTWEIDIAVPVFERKETEIYKRNKNVG